MAEPLILSGKPISQVVYNSLQNKIKALKDRDCTPGLAAVLVGKNPASHIYVRNKTKCFSQMGLYSETFCIPEKTTENELLSLIQELNEDEHFHGILVQMPLPKHIDETNVFSAIDPYKDVDGFHPINLGLLAAGKPRFVPCTPKGIMRILAHHKLDPSGQHVVVLGRSNIVGRPVSILTSLKASFANATTTICHSGTRNLSMFTTQADILIAALGVPEYIKAKHVKAGSIVIDVGINRVEDHSARGYHVVGDVAFNEVQDKVSAITPVPGGVGPMTIAMLVENTVEAAERSLTS